MGLAQLQAAFAQAVVGDDLARFAPCVKGEAGVAERRLGIYQHSVFSNWINALADTYAVVQRLVGEAFFREAARQYALADRSRSGDLNHLGAGFGDFLAGYAHARELPYLPDVARLEWAHHQSQLAADGAGFDFAALAAVPAERQGELRFRLHPAVRIVRSAFPVLALWEANQDDRHGTPDRTEGPDVVLLARTPDGLRLSLLDAGDAAFLEALARGESLEAALEALPDDWDLAARLPHFAATGVIDSFALPAA